MNRSAVLMLFFIAFVGFAAKAASSDKIIGMWNWTNSSADYPIYIEFNNDGDMLLHKMKQSGLDTDYYKWNVDGSTIYYTRPAADEKIVNKFQIVRNDGTTMILHDSHDNSDLWLEKIKEY